MGDTKKLKAYKVFERMMRRGGGMENMLMCLRDVVKDVIIDCDRRVADGVGSNTDKDIEYLRVLFNNLNKTYKDYCNRYGDEDG